MEKLEYFFPPTKIFIDIFHFYGPTTRNTPSGCAQATLNIENNIKYLIVSQLLASFKDS